MTNARIIFNEAITNEIYTEEQAIALIEKYGALPIHTFKKWNSLGYKVKKGEHARVTTKLWKPITKKVKAEDGEDEKKETKMYLCKSYLFTLEQVELMA